MIHGKRTRSLSRRHVSHAAEVVRVLLPHDTPRTAHRRGLRDLEGSCSGRTPHVDRRLCRSARVQGSADIRWQAKPRQMANRSEPSRLNSGTAPLRAPRCTRTLVALLNCASFGRSNRWSGRLDSNQRPHAPKAKTLTTQETTQTQRTRQKLKHDRDFPASPCS